MSKFNLSTVSLVLVLFLLTACGSQNKKSPINGTLAKTEQDQDDSLDSQKGKLSIAQELTKNGHLPVEERVALYRRLRKERPNDYNFENERE